MGDVTILIIVALVIAVFGGAFYFLISKSIKELKSDLKQDSDNVLMEWLKNMQSSVEKNSEVLEKQLKSQESTLTEQLRHQRESMDKQTKLIWERLENASQVISGVQKHLGGLNEFSKDMKDLSNILKSPKLRGGLGEQFLYEILSNALPKDLYKAQHKFRSGDICDAIVKTDRGLIPIDSKFPMENFKAMLTLETQKDRDSAKKVFVRDVKKRIDEISGKYILPEEGTTEQAIMYIPSENVYYELIVNTPEIENYAKEKNVVMASPNTLSYFLKVILVAYQQNELQQHAGEILKALGGIKVEAQKFNEDLEVLDGHIGRTAKSMDNVKLKYLKLFSKLEAVESIDKPEQQKLL